MSEILNGVTSLATDNTPGVANATQIVFATHYYKFAPILGATGTIHSAIALSSVTQTITTAITQPDFPRRLTITGNATGNTGTVTINGLDVSGAVISDPIAINGTATVNGAIGFASVTSIALPVQTHAGTDTLAVGVSATVFAIPISSARKAFVYRMAFNGTTEAGTFTNSTVSVSANLYTTVGTADGSKVIELIWFD